MIHDVCFLMVIEAMKRRDKLEQQSFIEYLEIMTHNLRSLLSFKSLLCFPVIPCH